MIRHVIHDNDRCRLVVEVDVGMVTLSLFFGNAPAGATSWTTGTGFSSHASVHLSPADARDRITLQRTLLGLERIAGFQHHSPGDLNVSIANRGFTSDPERRVSLDVLHRSVCDITRRPTA